MSAVHLPIANSVSQARPLVCATASDCLEGAGLSACRFAGSSMLQEDHASMRLEVDDHGLPRVSTDIWSATTSKSPSRAVSTANSR